LRCHVRTQERAPHQARIIQSPDLHDGIAVVVLVLEIAEETGIMIEEMIDEIVEGVIVTMIGEIDEIMIGVVDARPLDPEVLPHRILLQVLQR